MKSLKLILFFLTLTPLTSFSQIAPKGKKTLQVTEKYKGEYMQRVFQSKHLSNNVINVMKKRLPKKLQKYGFNDITITEVGQVLVPISTTTKMGNLVSNKSIGQAQLQQAKTVGQIERAVDKMYEEEIDGDWKFQVNILDNITNKVFKIRLSLTYKPKYIIKESDDVIDYRK